MKNLKAHKHIQGSVSQEHMTSFRLKYFWYAAGRKKRENKYVNIILRGIKVGKKML